jgi:hypothetical protein
MKDWLGNTILSIAGGIVIIGLMMLNAYMQRLARMEERQRLERISAENIKRERLAASQSRRPDGSSETTPKGRQEDIVNLKD